MSGIRLTEVDDTTIPTPPSGKVTLFVDDADGEPKYKDDTGTVNDLVGTPGTPGAAGDPGEGVPTGGTTGQRLAKASNDDYDTEWVAPADATITVEEDGETPVANVDHIVFNGATVTDDTGGQVTVTITGGSGPANAVYLRDPAPDPDADDDEGTGADTDPVAGWTTLGTVTTFDRDTTFDDSLYIAVPGNANTRVDGAYKSHALADGEAFVARIDGDTVRSDFNRVGIFIGVASASGRIDTMAVVSASGNRQMEVLAMTNATSLSGGVGSASTVPPASASPFYLAIRRNSSTSYDYLIGRASPLGILWTTHTAGRDPSFTQAVCGIFVNAQNGSTAVKGVFAWVRFYAALPVGIAP
jgi:hypothetical protein